MIDPSLAVQKAIVAALKARTALVTLLGGARIYDRVPAEITGDYVQVGDSQTLEDAGESVPGAESFETVHVWSDGVGKVQSKRAMAEVVLALGADLTIEGHHLIEWEVERVQHQDGDEKGLTSHSFAVFRYVTEPA